MNATIPPTPGPDSVCLCLGKTKRCGRCALIAAAKARQATPQQSGARTPVR